MNKMNITMLVVHLEAAAKYARLAGLTDSADFFKTIAEIVKTTHSEDFVA